MYHYYLQCVPKKPEKQQFPISNKVCVNHFSTLNNFILTAKIVICKRESQNINK